MLMVSPALTPKPPYYAVIFTSVRTDKDGGYTEMAQQILALASTQAGFLGFESARENLGISISYWKSRDAIADWKENVLHHQAQRHAKDWYTQFRVRICYVEREYGF
jgi:heme-degrading monooxygenase HmoA